MGKILKISPLQNKHLSCNVCAKRLTSEITNKSISEDKIHLLLFGKDNHSMGIHLCTECLNEFSDVLWKYLEEMEK